MRDSMVSTETWNYECSTCLHQWNDEYEVWQGSDGHGGAVVGYLRNGHRCTSPWSELVCPACGGYEAKILPTHRDRRPTVPRQRGTELEMLFRLRRLHCY